MISVDTETSGLWFSHGCTTFAIGVYDAEDVSVTRRDIDPETRQRKEEFPESHKHNLREAWKQADLVAIHNSGFDVKALVEAEVFDQYEPFEPEFWTKIVDTTILSHLHHNTDDRLLKKLTTQYLDTPYESEEKLNDLVKKCRLFVRSRRPTWMIASESVPQLRPSGAAPKWHKNDMWLPLAVVKSFSEKELSDYGISPSDCRTLLDRYLTDDCVNTYDLAQSMLQAVIEDHGDDVPKFLEVNNQILHVIYKMEHRGTGIHSDELNTALDTCESWISKLKARAEQIAGVKNITDDKLRKILFDDMGFEAIKMTKGGKTDPKPSVSADTLIAIKRELKGELDLETGEYITEGSEREEFVTKMMALKKYEKKKGYLTNFKKSMIRSKVHTSFHIVGTDTLRMSAKNPPLQTVSKAVNPFEEEFDDITALLESSPPLRSVFGPEEGYWWLCNDYSQLQLRIFAVVTGEQDMIEAFNRGYDAHDYTARKIFGLRDKDTPSKGQRRVAKNVNFGFIFGASAKKIELTSGMPGLWSTVCEMFPNAHDFIQYQKELLKAGNPVRTLGGYPLDVPVKEVKWKASHEKAAHAAVCYIVQGSEGEIVKRAMRMCDDYLTSEYPQGHLTLQVHDELDFNMPARFPKKHGLALKNRMEEAAAHYGVHAPVECELVMKRWDIGKPVKFNL